MTKTCWAPGCRTGYDGKNVDKRHMFAVPTDQSRRLQWNRKIPRDGVLKPSHSLCDLHFDERYIVKTFDVIVNGKVTKIPRERWMLTDDALPTIFPNLPSYLSTKPPKQRRLVHRRHADSTNKLSSSFSAAAVTEGSIASDISMACGVDTSFNSDIESLEARDGTSTYVNNSSIDCESLCNDTTGASNSMVKNCTKAKLKKCVKCKQLSSKLYEQNKKLRLKQGLLRHMRQKVKLLQKENEVLKRKCNAFDSLPPKMKLVVTQTMQNSGTKAATGNRFCKDWIVDALLIKCKSAATYKMLREQGYLPLPSVTTLNRHIQNLRPEFGFDRTLCHALTEKLKAYTIAERRGMLMFDELQISKHLDFRADLAKTVGFVDFGDLTCEQLNSVEEGDHALVFLFRPHLNGWVQTIGCFCSAGATPSVVLAKLILEAIVLLENCGACVDGLVCDGASTNRKALKELGWCGTMGSVCNKMVNPCDKNRSIYFFCDVPHLIKTARNNLLHSKMFSVRNQLC
jgi:Transposase protein/THAP domain